MSQVRPPGSSPVGRVYIPSSPPLQEDGIIAFPSALELEFRIMLEQTKNRSIFDQAKKATYRRWLENPRGPVEGNTPDEQTKDRNDRNAAIADFQLDEGCIYRKAEQRGNTMIRPRYVALNSNAFEIIQKEHRALQHYGIEKTYERISENYYGITKRNVAWVVKRCNVCSLNSAAKTKAPVIPILSLRCLDRIQFDLMDFRTVPDQEFKWILQIKDTFSKYIWLIPLPDKEAETVANAIEIWIGQNGRARRL
jgi:hypothetical protein